MFLVQITNSCCNDKALPKANNQLNHQEMMPMKKNVSIKFTSIIKDVSVIEIEIFNTKNQNNMFKRGQINSEDLFTSHDLTILLSISRIMKIKDCIHTNIYVFKMKSETRKLPIAFLHKFE